MKSVWGGSGWKSKWTNSITWINIKNIKTENNKTEECCNFENSNFYELVGFLAENLMRGSASLYLSILSWSSAQMGKPASLGCFKVQKCDCFFNISKVLELQKNIFWLFFEEEQMKKRRKNINRKYQAVIYLFLNRQRCRKLANQLIWGKKCKILNIH